ncbi:C2 and GRAM domain-containing protein At5g50170 [Phragmites australis]|uniref:C2 and GRAM domain-containing protein At5g50170 n=1 Tax=Phragmites australis TaxID=29695 RepID=UPI002D77734A|nr:C2 and GRAM domain-containing protein At5g50170 [Phragmites australis]
MRLYVYVLEARGLPAPRPRHGLFYAKVTVGRKQRFRTQAVEAGPGPGGAAAWNEEFVFAVGAGEEREEEVEVAVARRRREGRGREVVGRVTLPVPAAAAAAAPGERRSVPPRWFTLQPPEHRRRKGGGGGGEDAAVDCGKILLTFSLYGEKNDNAVVHLSPSSNSRSDTDAEIEKSTYVEHPGSNGAVVDSPGSRDTDRTSLDNSDSSVQADSNSITEDDDLVVTSPATANGASDAEPMAPDASFEEAMEVVKSRSRPDMPEDLDGSIIFEHTYLVESKDLNHLLFGPDSQFFKDLREVQGTMDYEEQPWTWKSKDPTRLTRTCQYTKAATRFMKAVKTSEEQTYLKADDKNFVVMTRVRTPEVPFGNCFAVVLLYKIIHSTGLSSGEESTHLTISYNVEFIQSTMMRSMIEGGVRDGLKENFESFGEILSRHMKLADSVGMDKEQLLAPLQAEHRSDIRLAYKYFCNFTAISTVLIALYVFVHILLSRPGPLMGLEFNGVDLPDTFGELITSVVVVLLIERLLNMVSHFVQARVHRGSDHGVKANGEGWLLTVALLEATCLPPVSCGSVDPYVVFSCNGITRTSSVQLRIQKPQWNEIMEFDAMEEPPAVLDVEVFNFDGPFDLAISLGHAEINFLKHTSVELADIWVPLEGKLAQTCQSRLHLRVFLENTKGPDTSMREYLSKMGKEVGKKLHVRSPHRNSTFQKLFGLPHEEFLIADYACSLKRKLPLQGRLSVSARIVGFYANLFGHKTKFFFLWEDVDEIEVLQPSFTTVGTPSLLFILKSGRGLDAKSGAKSQDKEGRLKFQFHSFASFSNASRTIIGLWKTKSSAIEHRAKLEEDREDESSVDTDDVQAVLSIGDVLLSKEYTLEHPIDADLLMGLFDGGPLETRTMSRVGCLDYSATPWEHARPGVVERHVSYKFNRYMSIFGGEVVSTQLKFPAEDGEGWSIHDIVTLHNVPFGDYFRVHLRYNVQSVTPEAPSSRCEILVGIEWLKSSKFQKRIARNICEKLAHRAKEVLEVAGKEMASAVSG